MSVSLVLLANSTTCNEMFDKGGETWPPAVSLKDRFSAEDPHVARKGGRVDRVKESRAGRWGNIHAVGKIKMSIIK